MLRDEAVLVIDLPGAIEGLADSEVGFGIGSAQRSVGDVQEQFAQANGIIQSPFGLWGSGPDEAPLPTGPGGCRRVFRFILWPERIRRRSIGWPRVLRIIPPGWALVGLPLLPPIGFDSRLAPDHP